MSPKGRNREKNKMERDKMEKEEKNNGKHTIKVYTARTVFLVCILLLGSFGIGLYLGREKTIESFESETVEVQSEEYQAKIREIEDWVDMIEGIRENINEYGLELLQKEINIEFDVLKYEITASYVRASYVRITVEFRYSLTDVSTTQYMEIQKFEEILNSMGKNADRKDISSHTYSFFDPEDPKMVTKYEVCCEYYIDISDLNF